ncbi:MAG: cysteine--tRNA ligase [Patescibacteria group bacterium]|nr:MAG: cysteine--tRNA ligase [Patescibacteria group bacterium]
MELSLYNTASRKKETFIPLKKGVVSMYNCGPTVYKSAHIGNLRAYVFANTLRRALEWNGYTVKQVINITDVGHLISDQDAGEDKMEKSARLEGKTAQEIAGFYTAEFLENLRVLNIDTKRIIFPKATENIAEQIELIKTLEKKGFTYRTRDGIYFDTSRFKEYGVLARLDTQGLREGARVEKNPEKKNVTDFALWKFSREGERRQQEWDSPWSVGFPGWHIECSAMSQKYLGNHFDIHTGGIDHIPIHHTNEIAQSETATGEKFVNYWMHSGFVNIAERKMAKSEENFVTLAALTEKGFSPLAYRYWLLTAHYRTTVHFTWEALEGSQTALEKLYEHFLEYKKKRTFRRRVFSFLKPRISQIYREQFQTAINNDLDTPKVIAVMWDLVKDTSISTEEKYGTMLDFDRVLGLGLADTKTKEIPEEILVLVKERELFRQEKDWQKSDELRNRIHQKGFEVLDAEEGPNVRKMRQ